MNDLTFNELQAQVVEWHDREWRSPDGSKAPIERVVMKLVEEVGELNGAIVKHLQGRKDEDWISNAEDEFGDVVICLSALADRIGQLHLADGRPSLYAPTFRSMVRNRWFGRRAGRGVRDRRGASYRKEQI